METKLKLFGGLFAMSGLLLALRIMSDGKPSPDTICMHRSQMSHEREVRTKFSSVRMDPGVASGKGMARTLTVNSDVDSAHRQAMPGKSEGQTTEHDAATSRNEYGAGGLGKPSTVGSLQIDKGTTEVVVLPAVRLDGSFQLPATALSRGSTGLASLVSSTPEIRQVADSITNRFYREISQAASASSASAQVEMDETSGEETVVVSQDEMNVGSLRKADLLFKAIFGNAAYNQATIESRREVLLNEQEAPR